MVQDHYHKTAISLFTDHLQPDQENVEPVPDGALINGRNVRDCSVLSYRTCVDTSLTLPSFNLTANEKHRLRFINVGAFAGFQIQIDEHEFAVTEVDGTDIKPHFCHRVNINAGQRYSVVISTHVTSSHQF